ncbi:MAG: DUF4317 domain-containing protein [Clostridia bacterium]|nr:DUF4317 domain-containing protein [Clostridia bacterium]
MTKKDISELKRRLKKEDCTFTRMCGCYVDGHKNMVVKFGETFLNLEDEEFFRYLEITKKTLSGTVGNNLLQLDFADQEEETGGKQQFMMGLKSSGLKNDDLLDRFYELIIDTYDYVGNFLILLFHDAYDVMTKTTDQAKLDESEEVYEYILGAICPVSLSKPGLGYRKDENRIGPRIRDWIVEAPETGFVFPAFSDRSSDIHSIIYYTKNAKEPHSEFMENGLGCIAKRTATEQKEAFHGIIKSAFAGNDEKSEHVLMEIQETINDMIEEKETDTPEDSAPVTLTTHAIQDILVEKGIPEEISSKIEHEFTEEFGDVPPAAEALIDTKALALNAQKKKEKELMMQVQTLRQELQETKTESEDTDSDSPDADTYDVFLKVKPEKVEQIKAEIIDGKKCIIIPLEEHEQAKVNGSVISSD